MPTHLLSAYDYENGFYLSCQTERMGKALFQYDLFKSSAMIPGDIIEVGVFKGASLSRLAMMRSLLGLQNSKRLIGFDTFAEFPEAASQEDAERRRLFIDAAGSSSASVKEIEKILSAKDCHKNASLIQGDVMVTIDDFMEKNPELMVSFANIDVDLYEPTLKSLQCIYPRLARGAVLMLDDYRHFPGATKAINEYMTDKPETIKTSPYSAAPAYIVKI